MKPFLIFISFPLGSAFILVTVILLKAPIREIYKGVLSTRPNQFENSFIKPKPNSLPVVSSFFVFVSNLKVPSKLHGRPTLILIAGIGTLFRDSSLRPSGIVKFLFNLGWLPSLLLGSELAGIVISNPFIVAVASPAPAG